MSSITFSLTGRLCHLADVIYVTDPAGTIVSGRLTTISRSALIIDSREFKPAPGLTIERRGDRLWNGTLIGIGIGGLLGAVGTFGEGCLGIDNTRSKWQCDARGGLAFGAVYGALIDWVHKGRTVIYKGRVGKPSLRVAPTLMPSAKVLTVRYSF
jgi:hypothetical protein